jgi:hypothetical protein
MVRTSSDESRDPVSEAHADGNGLERRVGAVRREEEARARGEDDGVEEDPPM